MPIVLRLWWWQSNYVTLPNPRDLFVIKNHPYLIPTILQWLFATRILQDKWQTEGIIFNFYLPQFLKSLRSREPEIEVEGASNKSNPQLTTSTSKMFLVGVIFEPFPFRSFVRIQKKPTNNTLALRDFTHSAQCPKNCSDSDYNSMQLFSFKASLNVQSIAFYWEINWRSRNKWP